MAIHQQIHTHRATLTREMRPQYQHWVLHVNKGTGKNAYHIHIDSTKTGRKKIYGAFIKGYHQQIEIMLSKKQEEKSISKYHNFGN